MRDLGLDLSVNIDKKQLAMIIDKEAMGMDYKTAAVEAHRAINLLRNEAGQSEPNISAVRRLADDAHDKMWALIDALDAADISPAECPPPAPAKH